MLVTNQTTQDYWFGPLHLLAGVGQTLTVDDTSDTSLYLTDDTVADAINNLYAASKITVSTAAAPFPRPTGMPDVIHGDGSPEGLHYAPQGSLYMRRDGGDAWHLYVKTSAVTLNTGWVALPGQELDFAQITANVGSITATTEGTSQTVVSGNQVYYDGSRVKLTFFVPKLTSSASLTATLVIYRDSTVIGQVFAGTVNTALQLTNVESGSASGLVDILFVGSCPQRGRRRCRRDSLPSSSVTWSRSRAAAI